MRKNKKVDLRLPLSESRGTSADEVASAPYGSQDIRENVAESAARDKTVLYERTMLLPLKSGDGKAISAARIILPTMRIRPGKSRVLDAPCSPMLAERMESFYTRLGAHLCKVLKSIAAPRAGVTVDYRAELSRRRDRIVITRHVRCESYEREYRDIFSLKNGELIG